MLMASHIGDSPARRESTFDSAFPSSSAPSPSPYPTAGRRQASTGTLVQPGSSSAGAGLSPHSYGSLPRSAAPPQASHPPAAPSYFYRSHSGVPNRSQDSDDSASQRTSERAPHRAGSLSGLRFISITKGPRALKRLASAGAAAGAVKEPSAYDRQISPSLANEDFESSNGHGSVASSAYHSAFNEQREDLQQENRQRPKPTGFNKAMNMFRFGSGSSSSAKSHTLDGTTVRSENSSDQKSAPLTATSSVEQLALLAQGPVGSSPSTSLRKKPSLTLRRRAPSLSSFAFPDATSPSASSAPMAYFHSSASSDTGHSRSIHHTMASAGASHSADGGLQTDRAPCGESRRPDGERKHYPPPSASTGSAAAFYRSRPGFGSVRRKPVPGGSTDSVDSSMLLQPSSFSSPSRIRLQQEASAAAGAGAGAGESAQSSDPYQTPLGAISGYESTADTTYNRPSQFSSRASSPVRADRSSETDDGVSSGSKTMSRIRKLSFRRGKKSPKALPSDHSAAAAMPGNGSVSPKNNISSLDGRTGSALSTGSEFASPVSLLSPTTERDVHSPTSPSMRSILIKGPPAPAPAPEDGPTPRSASAFSGLVRVTSLRKRTRDQSSPDVSTPMGTTQRSTSPQATFQSVENDVPNTPAIDSQVESAANQNHHQAATFAAGPIGDGKLAGRKRNGSVGGGFLSRSNSFLTKASASTFGVGGSRKAKGRHAGSAPKLSISGPVHLGVDGEESGGGLGGGATVITGGAAEAFAMLAAKSSNPGAVYVRSATTPVPGSGGGGGGGGGGGAASRPVSPALVAPHSAPVSILKKLALDNGGPLTSVLGSESGPPGNADRGKTSSPSIHHSPVNATKPLSGAPRKSSTSIRSPTPLAAPLSDVILPSEMKHAGEDYAAGITNAKQQTSHAHPQVKMFVKAELAQRLDQVLQHPEAPTRKLAHNHSHSRTLTPHGIQVAASMLPPDLIGGAGTSGAAVVSSAAHVKGKLSRGSIDVIPPSGGIAAAAVDAPIVTIGPTHPSGGPRAHRIRHSIDATSSSHSTSNYNSNFLTNMGNSSLYGLGLDSTYTYDRESPVGTLDSNLQVVQRKAPPNDVPQSPGESPAISSGSPTMPGEVPAASSSVPAAGRNLSSPLPSSSSRPQARPARSQARVRTVSLASLLGLGIPDSSTFDFEMTVNNSTVDHGITGLSGLSLSDVRHAGASTFDSGMTKGARDGDGDGGISGLGGQTLSEGSHVGMSTFDSTATRRVVEGGPGDDNGRPALTGQGSSEGHAPYVQRVFDWNNGSVSDVLDFAAGDVSRDAGGPELDFLHSHDSRRASAHEANGLGDDFLNSYDSRRSDVHQRNDDFLQSQDPRRTMTRTQGSHGHGEDDFLQSYDPRRVSAHERNWLGDDFLQSHDSRRVSVHEEVGAHGTAMHLLSPSIGAPSRPISYATSGHEASMGHHSHPHVSSPPFPLPQSNRAWGESGGGARRGSIGASQPARSPAMTDGDAFERSAEDDVVAELPPTTSHMGTASARASVQSQGAGAGAGPSRHGSGIYTPSEVDTDADSLMDAEVVMASRIELQRGGLGSGRNEGHPASSSSSSHLDAGHPHDASERPVSMDARQRKMLEQEMEREASRESAKLVGGGQTLRPLVVEDGHLRYSRQAEIVSGSDIERSDASGLHGDEPVPVEARHGSDADLPQSSLPNAENDATAERSPSMQTGAESTIRSTSARRRARKLSYATAEEAIAARRQEQAEREERMRAREAKRQADRQARYANKKKTDPLLAARLALFGLQAPEAGSGGSEQQHQRTGSSERSGTPRSVELARAEYQGAEHSSSGGGEGPLLRFSDLVDMDDDQLDVPCESTGRDDTRSMLVQQGPHILDQRVSMPGPDVWPGMGGGATYGDSQEDVNGPLTDFGGISVQTDWHSAQSHHHRRASSTQRMVAASPVSPSFPAEAYRSSPASPQVPK